MPSTIQYAGYGCYNNTSDCTGVIQSRYGGGTRVFTADNGIVGDPAPGLRKFLYIIWDTDRGERQSGVTGENDGHGISVP